MNLSLILQAISTGSALVIGVAASVLAYQQFTLSKSKLKFDLYEKRFDVFNVVRDFASTLALRGEADAGQFYRRTIQRHFLFEDDVCNYIDDMYDRANQIERTKLELSRPNLSAEERQRLNKQLVETKTWFFDQSDHMIKVFSKDLSISSPRGRVAGVASYPIWVRGVHGEGDCNSQPLRQPHCRLLPGRLCIAC